MNSHLICRYDRLLEEYARYSPFGLNVAASFLQILHANKPPNINTIPEIIQLIFDWGGESVDEELRSLIVHIYRLYERLNWQL